MTQPLGQLKVELEDRPPPGVRRLAFYCDESGITANLTHYGFGALITPYQRRGQFVEDFRGLVSPRFGEIKWNKTGAANLAYYKRIVDYFFQTSWLYFHCIVVKRAWVDVKKFHGGNYDLARRKHFTRFLTAKMRHIVGIDRNRQYEFRVYVDPIASVYRKADEAVQRVGNNMLNRDLGDRGLVDAARKSPIEKVITIDSKDRPEVQMCDLLLGAVMDSWNQVSTNPAKAELKEYVASYLGWQHLRHGTFAKERKFNLWWLTDRFAADADRAVRAESVRLTYPLPPVRHYVTGRGVRTRA